MATTGRIGVLRPDGRVESIYNHYDSYPEGAGRALEALTDPKDIDELISLGNRRGLYADEDWRDKGKLFNEPSKFYDNEEAFFDDKDGNYVDYKYLFKDGGWHVGETDGWDRTVRPLVHQEPQVDPIEASSRGLLDQYKAGKIDLGQLHDQLIKVHGNIKPAFEWLLKTWYGGK